jgi:hypothetical protein
MPLVETVRPDADKIIRLIRAQDPLGEWGAIARFARQKLQDPRRHPQSLRNLRVKKLASVDFITQVADALGVPVSEITLPEDQQRVA